MSQGASSLSSPTVSNQPNSPAGTQLRRSRRKKSIPTTKRLEDSVARALSAKRTKTKHQKRRTPVPASNQSMMDTADTQGAGGGAVVPESLPNHVEKVENEKPDGSVKRYCHYPRKTGNASWSRFALVSENVFGAFDCEEHSVCRQTSSSWSPSVHGRSRPTFTYTNCGRVLSTPQQDCFTRIKHNAAVIERAQPQMKSPEQTQVDEDFKPTLLSAAKTSLSNKIWLDAWEDPAASLKLNPFCLLCSDLSGDGDYKIVVALSPRELRVYKGKAVIAEIGLLAEPIAVIALFPELSTPRTPTLAVASGSHLFIYRNLRPFYKFTVPPSEVCFEEQEAWKKIMNDPGSVGAAIADLLALRQSGKLLTNRSRCLISMQSATIRSAFIESVREKPLGDSAPITCLATLNKSSEDERGVSLAVLGVESGQILILNPAGMKVAKQIDIGATPAFIDTTGLFDVNFRIVVGCRNNRVLTIKNGKVTGNPIETMTEVCGVLVLVKHVIIGCIGSAFYGYHVKGHQLFSVSLPAPISTMSKFQIRRASNLQGSIMALKNGEVRFYESSQLLTVITCSSPTIAMRFGPFGREDASVVLIQETGAIIIKILQRQAQLEAQVQSGDQGTEQDVPLPIPKRTQLYVDQMMRERDQAVFMHQAFQQDLAKLRLKTAQTFIKVISDGQGTLSSALASNLRLNAQVLGLGPKFKIRLSLKNNGSSALMNVFIMLMFDVEMYDLSRTLLQIPLIVPAVNLHTDVDVQTSEKNAGSREIRIAVSLQNAVSIPIINAVLVMPPVQF